MTRGPGWTSESGAGWTKTLPGRPGEMPLLLRVSPDPDDGEEPWLWEVVQGDPEDAEAEYEIDVGGSMNLEEAMEAATARALAYLGGKD